MGGEYQMTYTKELTFEILGDPIPAARPRFSKGHCYQPARNREYRLRVAQAAQNAMQGSKPLEGALSMDVRIYRKYKRTARLYGDVDNHLKALLDGMNGIVFADDGQVVEIAALKCVDKINPRVEVEIHAIAFP